MSVRFLAAAGLTAALAITAATAHASAYTAEYVFGDSLSDNGNAAEVAYRQSLPNPPSYGNSFTNGPVAAQVLAGSLGLTLRPSLWVTAFQDTNNLFGGASFVPGTNYAVAGATAASNPLTANDLLTQVAAFGASNAGMADPNALYVVMIGGNDVRGAALQGTGAAAVTMGVQTELAAIQVLADKGAKSFLVVNVPNIGVIPELAQDNPMLAGAATQYSLQYNLLLGAGLASLDVPDGTNLTQFDLYSFNAALLANPAAYGLTNTTDRCYTATPLSAATSPQCGAGAANIDQFAYWDSIHPTAKVQALWASGMEAALGVAVPEPSTMVLLSAGVLGLLVRRRSAA